MRGCVWVWAAALLAIAAARRLEQDFEFDEAPDTATARPRRPRRYVYDPQNPLCRALVCKKREVCLLRDAFTALCATKKDVLRRGDLIVAAAPGSWERGDDEDVFYEARPDDRAPAPLSQPLQPAQADRCVGCGGAARAAFLCGSDNRTYSSLCRLDLHNCVRRTHPPVRLACRGFCPCPTTHEPPRESREPLPRPDERRRRRLESAHNEVLPERSFRRNNQGHEVCQLDKMANRLLDWFSVLMDEAGGVAPPEDGFPRDCKPEVRWMFAHLDAGGDGALSAADLYALRHDERERCLRPFLASCGGGGWGARARGAGRVARGLVCVSAARGPPVCRASTRAPCAAACFPYAGAYVPSCDARGFYRPRQCHAALAVCWCVDAHGVELPGSRTKGAPACPGENETENSVNETEEEGNDVTDEQDADESARGEVDGEGGPADDEDAAGSGDRELRF